MRNNELEPYEARVFLSAQWRYLLMLNYEVEPSLLQSYLPLGTELDVFNGKTYLSLVGFRFTHVRVCGMSFPCHQDFDEINLRFYVRRKVDGVARRAVVFIREIAPRYIIAAIARNAYNEQYITLPTRHNVVLDTAKSACRGAEYRWRRGGRWERIHAQVSGALCKPEPGSLAHFVIEHYWAYTKRRDGGTMEYRVAHAPWRLWHSHHAGFEGDANTLYGPQFDPVLRRAPDSAFIADGSAISIFRGRGIL